MPSPLARSIRRSVASRTWPTLPAAPSSSSIVAVWIESTTTRPGRSARATSTIRPTSCSARTRTPSPDGPSSNPRRAARSRTWPGDSSPVAYSTPAVPPEAWLRPAAAWSRSVDLPIPGSPPTSTSDPGTSPPPRTRSSSAMPRLLRGRSASAMPARPAGSLAAGARDAGERPLRPRRLAHDGLDQGVPAIAGAALAFPAEEGLPARLADEAALGPRHR